MNCGDFFKVIHMYFILTGLTTTWILLLATLETVDFMQGHFSRGGLGLLLCTGYSSKTVRSTRVPFEQRRNENQEEGEGEIS